MHVAVTSHMFVNQLVRHSRWAWTFGPYDVGVDQSVQKPRYYLTSVVTIPKVGDNPLVEGLREMGMQSTSTDKVGHHIAPGSVEDASRDGVNGQPGEDQRTHPTVAEEQPRIAALRAGDGPQPGELDENTPDPFQQGSEARRESITEAEVQEMDQLNQEWAQLIKGRPEVEVLHLAQSIPIASRRPKDVLAAVSLMYCRLRSLRIPIPRVHSDRAKEFIGKEFRQWCATRDLWRTTTSGSEPQSNSRAEMEVGAVRNLARTMLRSSGAPNAYWPLAIRCASETRFRQQLMSLGVMVPRVLPFGLKALARKKPWHRTSTWESPNIAVRLWGPASDLSLTSGGYYAEMPDGRCIRTTAIIVPKWKSQACQVLHAGQPQKLNPEAPIGDSPGLENPDEVPGLSEPGAGPGLADHLDFEEANAEQEVDLSELVEADQPLEIVHEVDISVEEPTPGKSMTVNPPRRRLHQKTTPLLPGVNATPTLRRIARTVGGESAANELDDMETWMLLQHRSMVQLVRELAMDVSEGNQCDSDTLQQMQREVQEIEVQLKKISGDEETTVKEEVLQTRTVSIQEVRQDMSAWVQQFQEEYETLCRTVVDPMTPEMTKDVIAKAKHVERIPSKIVPTIRPPYKKRGRIVACGNYASAPDGEVSAGGVETICLRTLMRKSAHMGWSISTIEIKKAFLNAPRVEKEGHVTIIEPPAVLVAMGVVPSSESWRVRGAIYGLVQSPHDWGLQRDSTFREVSWICDDEMLKLVETPERHLWKIVTVNQDKERGYLCSYVDDLMITGKRSVVDSTIKLIESCWECSSREYVNEITNTRFCGYELRWDGDSLLLTQPSYTMDLVSKYNVTGKEREPSPKITPEKMKSMVLKLFAVHSK